MHSYAPAQTGLAHLVAVMTNMKSERKQAKQTQAAAVLKPRQ